MAAKTLAGTYVGVTDCGDTVIGITADTFCATVNGINFGGGKVISSSGSGYFSHKMSTKIKGVVLPTPKDIERTVSIHCKTQKVRTAEKYAIEGFDSFPLWKKTEIEDMFTQENVKINGTLVVNRGGSVFRAIGDPCNMAFAFNADIEECPTEYIFGCITKEECLRKGTVVVVSPDNDDNTTIFDTQGLRIGTVGTSLQSWLESQSGVTSVSVIANTSSMPCSPHIAYLVDTDSPISFYLGGVTSRNKVYGYVTEYDNPDLAGACRGVDYTACQALSITNVTYQATTCGALTIGSIIYHPIGCGFTDNMTFFDNMSSATSYNSVTKILNIAGYGSKYILPLPYNYASTTHTVLAGEESGFLCGLNSMVVNAVYVDGFLLRTNEWHYNEVTDIITKVGGWDVGTNVEYLYAAGIAKIPYVNNEILTVIDTPGCRPTEDIRVSDGGVLVTISALTGEVRLTATMEYSGALGLITTNNDGFNLSLQIPF